MLDAIIIAGLRSWTHGERERERDGHFFGIFILKSVDFSNLYSNLFETVGRWADICIYIVAIIGVS